MFIYNLSLFISYLFYILPFENYNMNVSLEGLLALTDTYFFKSLLHGNTVFYLFCPLITNIREHLYINGI